MVEPIYQAVKKIKNKKSKVILLSAKGKKFDQPMARRLAKLDQLIIISGRYEGVDERVAKYIADEEISIGDYILTGGELPAMVIVDTIARLVPNVISKGSLEEESPVSYTRPESIVINGKARKVPKILLSGNHKEIEKWRKKLTRIFK